MQTFHTFTHNVFKLFFHATLCILWYYVCDDFVFNMWCCPVCPFALWAHHGKFRTTFVVRAVKVTHLFICSHGSTFHLRFWGFCTHCRLLQPRNPKSSTLIAIRIKSCRKTILPLTAVCCSFLFNALIFNLIYSVCFVCFKLCIICWIVITNFLSSWGLP